MANLHQLAEYRTPPRFVSVLNVQNALAALGGEAHRDAIATLVTGSIRSPLPKTVLAREVDDILKGNSDEAGGSFKRVFGPQSHRWAFAHDRIKDEVIRQQHRAAG